MPVVFNTKPRLMVLPTVMKDGRALKFEGQRSNPLRLLPGRNRCNAEYWAECQKNHVVRIWVDEGYLRWVPDQEIPDPEKQNLSDMSDADLKSGLADPETPEEWKARIRVELIARAKQRRVEAVQKNVPGAPVEPEVRASDHLAVYLSMGAAELKDMVADLDDVDTLRELAGRESRVTVQQAISARLESLRK